MKSHLEIAQQTYIEHFKDAMYYSWVSLKSSFYFFIHALSPNTFQKNGSTNIKFLNDIFIEKFNKLNQTPNVNDNDNANANANANIEIIPEQTSVILDDSHQTQILDQFNYNKKRKLYTIDEI